MGMISIAVFVHKPGKEAELLKVIAERLPLLRSLGLATERPPILMKSSNDAIIQISEWADKEAIVKAHQSPEVIALWGRFEPCSKYVPLESLDEVNEAFATFEAIGV